MFTYRASQLPERFQEKFIIDDDPGCWLWLRPKDNGYAYIWWERRNRRAHRLIYELLVGPIPDGMELDHTCRHRNCVNPSHLEPVTRLENVARSTVGEYERSKTHCSKGHEYTSENIYSRPSRPTWRECRECYRLRYQVKLSK